MISAKQMRESLGDVQAWKAIYLGSVRVVSDMESMVDEGTVMFEIVPGKDPEREETFKISLFGFPTTPEFLNGVMEELPSNVKESLGVDLDWWVPTEDKLEMTFSNFASVVINGKAEWGQAILLAKLKAAFGDLGKALDGAKSTTVTVVENGAVLCPTHEVSVNDTAGAVEWATTTLGGAILQRLMGPNPIDFNELDFQFQINW